MTSHSDEDRMFPDLGIGLGLRPSHYADVCQGRSRMSWFEVITENFMGGGGRPLFYLDKVRRDFPIALHGVSLSIGSFEGSSAYLRLLQELVDRIQPAVVSDHLCWTGVSGRNLHDLLPLPFTEEALSLVVENVSRAQDHLGRRILLENVSSYLEFRHSEMTEWEFLSELCRRADCGILLDVNNIYVSSVNHGFDPMEFLRGIPVRRVGQVHLAGHSRGRTAAGGRYLVDTHDHPVCEEVWELYGEAVRRFGRVSTMVEWDARIPSYEVLENEALKAKKIREGGTAHETIQRSSEFREFGEFGLTHALAGGAADLDAAGDL